MTKKDISTEKKKRCIREMMAYYKCHGRHDLAWRKTRNPYRILVSEIMLQQTQVARVIPKYNSFLKKFPTLSSLAHAPLGEVLREWQGLGYNRRAKMLHECAKQIMEKHKGIFPKSLSALGGLKGVGPYTAGAIMIFAYNKPVPVVETNIRTVMLYYFFQRKSSVSDSEILTYCESMIDIRHAREWHWALMDYGTYLKTSRGNPNRKSTRYTKQTPFKNSDRQIRGAILRLISERESTQKQICTELLFDKERIISQLKHLVHEGMLSHSCSEGYMLPS